MAETIKLLGQVAPAGGVLTDAYTVDPAAQYAVISTVAVCNRSSTRAAKFRVAIAIAGAVDTPAQYVYYDERVPPNRTWMATIGATLATSAVLRVYSDTGLVSFNVFGDEVS